MLFGFYKGMFKGYPELLFPSEAELKGSVDAAVQSKLQWQKVLASPNLWTDMTLILH